jgi:hypothetical protein
LTAATGPGILVPRNRDLQSHPHGGMVLGQLGQGLQMGRDSEGLLLIVFVVPVFLGLMWLKFKMARGAIEKRLQSEGIQAEIMKVGIPPLRHWLSNRKGDSWCKLRFSDGSEKWARLRGRIFGGSKFDIYD